MIDKNILLGDLEKLKDDFKEEYYCNNKESFYAGSCAAIQEMIRIVKEQWESYEWIDSSIAPVGSEYVLLSLKNVPVPCIGKYKEDENGGAYYIGDNEETCSCSPNMFVNAWMALPMCCE